MEIRMLRQISGTRNGVEWPPPGEVCEVSDDEAEMLIRNKFAEAGEPGSKKAGTKKPATKPAG